jgi:hypothetical protein
MSDVLAAILVTGGVMIVLGASILHNLTEPPARPAPPPISDERLAATGRYVRYGGALVHVDCLAARRDGRAACERCALNGVGIGAL